MLAALIMAGVSYLIYMGLPFAEQQDRRHHRDFRGHCRLCAGGGVAADHARRDHPHAQGRADRRASPLKWGFFRRKAQKRGRIKVQILWEAGVPGTP